MGRCGEWFLVDAYPDVEVELLSLGKATSGGLIPICYTLGSDRMSEPAGELYTGGTFAGSPVGCAVGIKLIEIIKRDNVLDNVKEIERIAKARFGAMRDKYEIVGDVRVKGCYQCVEFVEDKDTKTPAHDLTREVVYAMERRGVIPIYEPAFNWFRPTPALNMPPELFALGCDIVEECVAEVSKDAREGHRMTYDSLPFSGIATFFKAPIDRGADDGGRGRGRRRHRLGRGHHQPLGRAHGASRPARGLHHVRLPAWRRALLGRRGRGGAARRRPLGRQRATSRSAPCGRRSATTTP